MLEAAAEDFKSCVVAVRVNGGGWGGPLGQLSGMSC